MNISILGHDLLKTSDLTEIKKEIIKLQDSALMNRPTIDFLQTQQNSFNIPYFPSANYEHIYSMVKYSDVLRTIHRAIKSETFRNGLEFKPAYVCKCPQCDTEFDYKTVQCDNCGDTPVEYDTSKLTELNEWVLNVNENNQSLMEVMNEIEDDLNTADDAYILLNKEYYIEEQTMEIFSYDIKEIIRIAPNNMRIIADKKQRLGYDWETDKKVYVCPKHRNVLIFDNLPCQSCGTKPLPAHFYHIEMDGQTERIYYAKGEIIHVSKYSPSKTYGFSPVLSVWQKVTALMDMDKYIKDVYAGQRPPKGLLAINTSNVKSVEKSWGELLDKYKTNKNPNAIYPLAIESAASKGQFITWLDFMKPLSEMAYTETRDEFCRKIGAVYGVMPIFQADISTSGGLNNEGLQITVTNRTIETSQQPYNQIIFPEIMRQKGIEDIDLELLPNEEQDEVAELQREGLKIDNATKMLNMGFEVDYSDKGEFEFSGTASRDMLSGQGGLASDNLPPSLALPNEQSFTGEAATLKNSLENIVKFEGERKIKGRENTYLDKLVIEFEKLVNKIDFSIRISKVKAKQLAKKLADKIGFTLKEASKEQLEIAYNDTLKQMSKELGFKISFSEIDQDALDVIQNRKVFTQAYDDMSKSLSSKLNDAIAKTYANPKEFTITKLVENMKEIADEETYRLERIARNETSNINNLARQNSYFKADPEGAFKYKWLGPDDRRTTKYSKAMKRDTTKGVTIKRLKELVKKNADQNTYTPARPFQTHINQRHTYVKVID